jgi:NAD(P)-dependent dehydrogenase (short-subunit alcohol dehydrogenase family)
MQDRVVVITGASSGIGAALAERVGSLGGQPVLAARREGELADVAARSGPRAAYLVADVTQREDVQRVFDTTLARCGHIDVWVNNAGRGITRPVSLLSDEEFDEMMLVNVKSALYGMQVVLPHFQERGRGHIINLSSLLGRLPFVPSRSAYSAAKHALNALTACLRLEIKERFPGIHVSTVSPGVVATGFGLSALGGGPDSRSLPMAQPAGEVADVIVGLIERPRADVYTRPGAQQWVADYFGAEDMTAAESRPPFARGPARP